MARPFGCVQLEFGFLLGPPDGRYLRRPAPGAEPHSVIVVQTVGAERRRLRGRRPRRVTEAEAPRVPITRCTLIRAEPFPEVAQAARWLEALRADAEAREAALERAVRELNEVLRAHRAAAADPHGRDVAVESAVVARVGYGDGEQVAHGRFSDAYALPPRASRKRRTEMLAPQERLAGILGGRESVLACEELVLRARCDLTAARPREAALQTRVALEALLAEVAGDRPELSEVVGELEGHRDAVGRAANAALEGDPSEELNTAVREAVERLEVALRRRRLLDTR